MSKAKVAAQASAVIAKLDEPEEEFTELEVQHMLEAQDRAGQKPKPVPVAEYVEAALPSEPGVHALDTAPVGSKIVVVDVGAVLATPAGALLLPKGDPAHKLPEGAKIQKRLDGYHAEQLSPVEDHPNKTYATALEAIADFTAHFHHA